MSCYRVCINWDIAETMPHSFFFSFFSNKLNDVDFGLCRSVQICGDSTIWLWVLGRIFFSHFTDKTVVLISELMDEDTRKSCNISIDIKANQD